MMGDVSVLHVAERHSLSPQVWRASDRELGLAIVRLVSTSWPEVAGISQPAGDSGAHMEQQGQLLVRLAARGLKRQQRVVERAC